MQLYFGSEWNEAGFSRLRLKSEEERKRLVGLLHSHALRCTSILACTLATTYTYIAWRGHRHTCRHVPCVPLAVWWTAVRRALCCARWEVGLLLGGFRPHRRTQHLTQTEGSCKLPFEASKANCIHPHRTRCLQHDVLPFELTAEGPFLCCYTPRPTAVNLTVLNCCCGPLKTGQREH